MSNFLFPMLVIKALEPDRDTRDLALGGIIGATVAGGNIVGGLVGRELLDRFSPVAAAPIKPVLPPPPAEPNIVVHELPAADRTLAMIKTAAAGAGEAYQKDPTPVSLFVGALQAIAGKSEPDAEQKAPNAKKGRNSQVAASE